MTEITLVCPECRTTINRESGPRCPTHGLYGLTTAALARLPDHPLLGQILDEKYALVDVLGSGGSGAVYLGLQAPLDRPVAVKILGAAVLAGAEARARFEREARALAGLTSPHTVRLLDYGVSHQGPLVLRNLAYLVMERLEGDSLQRRLADGPMSPAALAVLMEALADSLDEAHAVGIVHRDLKPANVILTRRHDGRELPRLIDFGIARVIGMGQTREGLISGTPWYMAPEQARGEGHQGPTVDVYALGAMAFEALTGHPPFAGTDQVSVLMAHCESPPPPLDPQGASPELAALEPVIHRALAKDPAARPQNAGAFARELRSALDGPPATTLFEPVPAGRAAGRRVFAWWAAGTALALIGVTILLIGGRTWLRPASRPDALAVAQPASLAPVPPASAPATMPTDAAPPATQPAPPASAAPPSTAPRPRPSETPQVARIETFALGEGQRRRLPFEAGQWQVTVEIVEPRASDDRVALAWEPGLCAARARPGTRRFEQRCTLSAPATLVVENPINLFGADLKVRMTAARAR